MKLNLSDFNKMSTVEKANVVGQLCNGPAEDVKDLEYEIMKYESLFDMSSKEMLDGIKAGTVKEDKEVSHWLFLLDTVKLVKGD